jgi:hypothetical protein
MTGSNQRYKILSENQVAEIKQTYHILSINIIWRILSSVSVTKKGFGLVIGFIDHLQVVTKINCNTSRITVIITNIKSSNHTLSLHRPTYNSSSTMNFPWPSPTENWLTRNADCLQDNSSARTARKIQSSFDMNACLQLRCLAIDVLSFRAFVRRRPHRKHSFPYIIVMFLGSVYRVFKPVWRRGRIPPPWPCES